MSIKISVLSPSIRTDGLKIIQECLQRQTLKDFEWLVEIGIPGKGHDLNAAFNRMIKRAKGELLVFYEDYTKIMDDGLERFWRAYQEYPDTLFTAPLGKVDNWEDKPRWDWRSYKQNENQVNYTDCNWNTCEFDWGAVPKSIMFDIGGFDEWHDQYWSFDNVNVGCRADLKGYKFKCVFSNPAVAWDHDKFSPHPFREKYNGTMNSNRLRQIRMGLKIDYLNART